jgi:hypothetical protein
MSTRTKQAQRKEAVCLSLRYALRYIKGGWLVLPLFSVAEGECTCGVRNCTNAGKHPRTPHGVKDASADKKRVGGWFGKWPHANVGIRTGRESGLVVLDVDPRHGGDASLKKYERDYSGFPQH